MKRVIMIVALLGGFSVISGALSVERGLAGTLGDDESRIRQGLAIAPVTLNLEGKNGALVASEASSTQLLRAPIATAVRLILRATAHSRAGTDTSTA
jgi:hypothetical protein